MHAEGSGNCSGLGVIGHDSRGPLWDLRPGRERVGFGVLSLAGARHAGRETALVDRPGPGLGVEERGMGLGQGGCTRRAAQPGGPTLPGAWLTSAAPSPGTARSQGSLSKSTSKSKSDLAVRALSPPHGPRGRPLHGSQGMPPRQTHRGVREAEPAHGTDSLELLGTGASAVTRLPGPREERRFQKSFPATHSEGHAHTGTQPHASTHSHRPCSRCRRCHLLRGEAAGAPTGGFLGRRLRQDWSTCVGADMTRLRVCVVVCVGRGRGLASFLGDGGHGGYHCTSRGRRRVAGAVS